MKKLFLLTLLLACVLSSTAAWAGLYTFTDSRNVWPGFESVSDYPGTDVHGSPDFLGGEMVFTGNALESITIDYVMKNSLTIDLGDIFLDSNGDGSWDYFINTYGTSSGTVDIYDINIGLTDEMTSDPRGVTVNVPPYLNSSDAYSGNIRDNHPVAVNPDFQGKELIGTAVLEGWVGSETGFIEDVEYSATLSMFETVFTLDPDMLIIGFGATCANDVVYENITPTPVPGAVWLLGTGVFGLIGLRRKMKTA